MKRLFILAYILASVCPVGAAIHMPRFFSDNMVLQREQPIRIWGKAARGERVRVQFNGAEAVAKADRAGRWEAVLPAMAAESEPRTMIVTGRDHTLRFENVLVGDVWLCSGQSNMEWRLDLTAGYEEELAVLANPNIRLLSVGDKIAFEEQGDINDGTWVVRSPETSGSFSGVGYYFGKFIEAETGVPVGLIDSSWGGTDIETWTSWSTMQQFSPFSDSVGKSFVDAYASGSSILRHYLHALGDDIGDRERWYDPKVCRGLEGWSAYEVPKSWYGELEAVDGIVWFRRYIELPASASGSPAALRIPGVDDSDSTYVNGVLVGSTNLWNEERNYEIPAGTLHPGRNLLVIRVNDYSGLGGIYGDPDAFCLEIGQTRYPLAGQWEYRPSTTILAKYNKSQPNSFASLLYNGMIAPLVGYGIKGVIWYQGENNVSQAQNYRKLFPAMIRDWRGKWGYDFPFCWVQLANYMGAEVLPGESEWAELREAQNATLSLPATGQAVITDIGDPGDIHPRNKRDVGYRLSRAALNVAYGRDDVAAGGPAYRSMERDGSRCVLTFDTTGALRPADGNRFGYLRGFSIAGADRRFVWARSYVLDENRIVVFSDEVDNPEAVRYGWANNPFDDDLTDASGLLASPFRTDDWPGITQ